MTRNPNYLGEVLIYASFAMATGNYIAYACFGAVWCTLFVINMLAKEHSNSKKEGWAEYKKKTNLFLPRLASNTLVDKAIWSFIFIFIVYDYNVGSIFANIKHMEFVQRFSK